MEGLDSFPLIWIDYLAFGTYFVVLCVIGLWVGRKEKTEANDYFLAGRSLPWYVVGSSFIASNISSEHFIGMIGAAFVYGICVATAEWGNVLSFSALIWFFIPFLLASRVFTTPEFAVCLFTSSRCMHSSHHPLALFSYSAFCGDASTAPVQWSLSFWASSWELA